MSADYSAHRMRGDPTLKTKYQVELRCRNCGHFYKRIIRAESLAELDAKPNPPCPKCRKVHKNIPPPDYAAGEAPAIGGSNVARGADMAAEMIMKDHGLTDIRGPTETRRGESSTVKLAPALQAQADNMFGGRGTVSPLLGGGQVATGTSVNRRSLKIGGMDPNSPMFRRAVLGGSFGGAAESGAAIAHEHSKRQTPQSLARIVNKDDK